jgi:hypothetical protein
MFIVNTNNTAGAPAERNLVPRVFRSSGADTLYEV